MSEPSPVPGLPPMTFDQFLAWEDAQEDRHEFIDGVVYAMASPSERHDTVVMNTSALLWNAAYAGNTCRVYTHTRMVRRRENGFLPDVTVTCAADGVDAKYEQRPCLVVEVLSPSSVRHDRVRKLARYQEIPSLRAYLIVSQQYRHVERHWRDALDAPWQREDLTAAEGRVPVPCPVEGVLTFDEIYRLAEVPDRPPLRRVREQAPGAWGDEPVEEWTEEPA